MQFSDTQDLTREVARLRKVLRDILGLAQALPPESMGIGGEGLTHWYIRDEVVHNIEEALK